MDSDCTSEIIARKKRQSLSLANKLDILSMLDAGMSGSTIAQNMGVSKATISRIKKQHDEILRRKRILELCGGDLNKKKFKGTEESPLEQAVYSWISEAEATGQTVTGPDIKRVAQELNAKLDGPDSFKASNGWLSSFKSRHFSKKKTCLVPKPPINREACIQFRNDFRNIPTITGVTDLNRIYSCGEIGSYWKMLPNKLFANDSDINSESKSRITSLACLNASGTHKLPLLVVSKFKNCPSSKNQPLIQYRHQIDACMTTELMLEWFTNSFIPEVKRHHKYDENKDLKILLLLDNIPCHPSPEHLEKICNFCVIILLPPETASLIHPLEQGLAAKFRRSYKYALITHLIIEKAAVGLDEAYRTLGRGHCLTFCKQAWDEVTPDDSRASWKSLIPIAKTESLCVAEVEDSRGLKQLLTILSGSNISLNDTKSWIDSDQHVVGWRKDHENLQESNSNESPCEDDSSLLAEVIDEQSIAKDNVNDLKEVYNAMMTLMNWSFTSDDEEFINLFGNLKICRQVLIDKLITHITND